MKIGLKLSFELGSLDTLFFENLINKYLLFEPYAYGFKNKTKAWDEKRFRKALGQYMGDDDCSAYDLNGNMIYIGITGTHNPHLSVSLYLDDTVFFPTNAEIENLINRPGFVATYLFDKEYTDIQSEKFEINFKGRKNISIERLETIKHTPYTIGVHGNEYDVRFNPGRRLLIGYTWLFPAYKMWFGAPFYKLVPKEKMTAFQYAIEIKEIAPELLYVQLFDKIEESYAKDSMFRQGKWAEWLDFDGLEKKYP